MASAFAIEITLVHSSVVCAGCKRNIRSSRHVCSVYDVFDRNVWLNKEKANILYRDIRQRNVVKLAQKLPFLVCDNISEKCMQFVAADQIIQFSDDFLAGSSQTSSVGRFDTQPGKMFE